MFLRKSYQPQTCDMGFGIEELVPEEPMNLKEVLNEIENKWDCWGTITIIDWENDIWRKFDYNIYNKDHQFYHDLAGWMYFKIVKKIKCQSCFMNNKIEIYVEKKEKRK